MEVAPKPGVWNPCFKLLALGIKFSLGSTNEQELIQGPKLIKRTVVQVCVSLCVGRLLPSSLYSPVEMPASRDKVIKSPRLAAIGVATLSGLMPTFLDAMITPIIMSPVEHHVRHVVWATTGERSLL